MSDYHTIRHKDHTHNDIVCVNWCLGNTCNFSCSYCPEFLHSGSHPWIEADTVLGFVNKLIDHYVDGMNKTLYVEFTGGEVTLYKDFLRLAQCLKDRGQWVGIISNGSRTPRFWEKAKHLIDHVCISYHPEEGNVQHLVDTINQITDHVDVHVNIMMKPDRDDFNKSIAAAYRIVEETGGITLSLQTLLVDFSDTPYEYTDNQKSEIHRVGKELSKRITRTPNGHRTYRGVMELVYDDHTTTVDPGSLITNNENSWIGWECNAGVEQLVVDTEGKIWRGWCMEGGLIGNVSDEVIPFPVSSVQCGKAMCHCNFDIMCTKYAP